MAKVEEPVPTSETEGPDGAHAANVAVPAELVSDSVGAYIRASLARLRGGETGVIPVVAGLLLVSILFQSANSHFLTVGRRVTPRVESSLFSLLAMVEVFSLLLGEIDLSIGFVSAIGGVIMAELVK